MMVWNQGKPVETSINSSIHEDKPAGGQPASRSAARTLYWSLLVEFSRRESVKGVELGQRESWRDSLGGNSLCRTTEAWRHAAGALLRTHWKSQRLGTCPCQIGLRSKSANRSHVRAPQRSTYHSDLHMTNWLQIQIRGVLSAPSGFVLYHHLRSI